MDNDTKSNYIGITLGPIMDTMSIMTKPGALWLSSYMFSYISKQLCVEIGEKIGVEKIITPFVPEKDHKDYDIIMNREDGVGLFHDHIIFENVGDIWDKLSEIKEKVIKDVALKLSLNYDLLKDYVMIKECRFNVGEKENPILRCGRMLDCMELPKVFSPTEVIHPVKSALNNKSVKEIAKNFVGIDINQKIDESKWNLICTSVKENGEVQEFKDLPSIAFCEENKGFKKNNYYCLLRADGDYMSNIISGLDDYRGFSQACLKYCDMVANTVKEYGGVTIFAGGDDLFAIVPCEGNTGTIFDLIFSIDNVFKTSFKEYIDKISEFNKTSDKPKTIPSLSFGAFICHDKYPLYEAVQTSAALLFDVAKKKNNQKKNCLALRLQKHSGQSENLIISKEALSEIKKILTDVLEYNKDKEKCNEAFLLSAAYKILTFDTLIDSAYDIDEVFKNIFDAGYHVGDEKLKKFLHNKLPELYKNHCKTKGFILIEKNEEQNKPSRALARAIRVIKFFVEKGDE